MDKETPEIEKEEIDDISTSGKEQIKSSKKSTEKKKNKKTSKEETLQKELDETHEQLLRVTAEYANFRSRSVKEKESSFSNAKGTVIKEFLSVADNLQRAIENDSTDFEGLKKGLEITSDELSNVLTKLGVEVYGESGDQFDPKFHNAVMHSQDENFGENVVTDVFQKGYKINDLIIRPAMVKVAN